jgi:capsule biosynthesis phosphatase
MTDRRKKVVKRNKKIIKIFSSGQMKIVILAGGSGTRLQGYSFPKPLNMIYGRPAIAYVLEKIPDFFTSVHFIYNESLTDYQFETTVTNLCKTRSVTFFKLPYKTRGAIESAFLGVEGLEEEPILFLDNDVIYNFPDDFDLHMKHPFLGYDIDTSDSSSYCFFKLDGARVTEIAEKRRISDIFGCGVYGFPSVRLFKKVAAQILARPSLQKEYYMSDLFVELLALGETIQAIHFKDIFHIGTKAELVEHIPKLRITPRRICFDLDNTLVTYPTIPGDYTTVKPIGPMIENARRLHAEGHTVIIHTARRMATHKHNVGAVIRDIGKITLDTLEKFGIPYDEIIFGKPIADVYIDDRGWNPYTQSSESMGLISIPTVEKIVNKLPNNSENRLEKSDNIITKSGNAAQLEGEIYYYENMPKQSKKWFAEYYGKLNNPPRFMMEHIDGLPLSYLWSENLLQKKHVDKIFEFLDEIHGYEGGDQIMDVATNYTEKLRKRFAVAEDYPFEGAAVLQKKVLDFLDSYIANGQYKIVNMIHGDCWFPNLLYTYKNELKCIDMRGKWGSQKTLSGDANYDFAKLYQSILGYDAIVFDLKKNTNEEMVAYFLEKCLTRGVTEPTLRGLTAGLVSGYIWSIRSEKKSVVWDWLSRMI